MLFVFYLIRLYNIFLNKFKIDKRCKNSNIFSIINKINSFYGFLLLVKEIYYMSSETRKY